MHQLPWRQVVQPYAPLEVLSADQIEAIHLTSLRILEELGMEVMSARGRALLKAAGAQVDAASHSVRLDRGLVERALASAPAQFTLTPRNEAQAHHSRRQSRELRPGRRPGQRA